MKFLRLEALFFLLLTAPAAVAQSNLPQCPPETAPDHWDNCSGVLTFRDGSKYAGGFVGGKMSGQGILAWANGDIYVGEFRNDKMDGQGTMSWANGDRYVGRFKDGVRSEFKDGVRSEIVIPQMGDTSGNAASTKNDRRRASD